jgi:diguanylate cyclase
MFWNKGKENADSPKLAANAELEGAALDTLGALLRTLGKYAFDLEELDSRKINELCEQWARHILIATPYPGREPETTGKPSSSGAERNWQGAREFVTQLRRRENAYVTANFKDMREVFGDFIQTLSKVFAEDQEDQAMISMVLNQLRTAIEGNVPVEVLKREAIQAINTINQVAEKRNKLHNSLLDELANRLKTMREELNAARREMELDPLTRLFNRRAFDQQLARTFELNRLSGQAACLLMIDVDHFKRINDNFGHPVGDQVLRQLADCCVQVFPRKMDFVARYGGEEFAIILQETTLDVGQMLGERLLEAVRAMRINHREISLSITASVGIAELDPRGTVDSWLQRADKALYHAKQSGRNRVAS